MTSELESFDKALEIVVKNDLKPIAVSSSNLIANESGKAPLENQGAFTASQVLQSAPVNNTQDINSQNTVQNQPLNDNVAVQSNNVMNTNDNVQGMNNNQTVVAPSVNNVQQVNPFVAPISNNNETIDNIEYKKPNNDGILTEAAVEVAGATNLDQMNINITDSVNKMLDNIAPQTENKVEEVKPMEMPTINQEVTAQEPTALDNRLFEGVSTNSNVEEKKVEPVADTPFTTNNVVTNNNVLGTDNTEISALKALETPASSENLTIDNTLKGVDSNVSLGTDSTINNTSVETKEEEKVEEPIAPATSVFDDHLIMPKEMQQFNIPTMDNNTLNETSDNILDNTTKESEDNILENTIKEPAKKDDEDFERKLDEIINRFKNELIDLYKSKNDINDKNLENELSNNIVDIPTIENTELKEEKFDNNITLPVSDATQVSSSENTLDNNLLNPAINNLEEKSLSNPDVNNNLGSIGEIDEVPVTGGKFL